MKKRLGLLVSLIAISTGCGSAHTIKGAGLPQTVLQPKDLPSWTRFENDAGLAADAGILGSHDRTGAWIARFRSARGIIVSRIDLYGSVSAAKDVFERVQSSGAAGVRSVPTPPLGDQRLGYLTGTTLQLKSVFWRRANAIGSIVVEGHHVGSVDAGALATTVDGRLEHAGG